MRRRFMSNKITPININNYLTIEARQNGLRVCLSINSCEYCIDGDGDWKPLLPDTYTEFIDIGQTLSFRGKLIPDTVKGIGTFTISEECNLLGNCMSLLFGDNAANNYSLFGRNSAFSDLFMNCNHIISVSDNFLPATTLAPNCYRYMFYGCTSLTTAPELPATTATDNCYNSMFKDCKALTTAPKLPATTLDQYCYVNMFMGCSSLTNAPELPATTLAVHCYESMFYGCYKLSYIKMLATDISAARCLYVWTLGVSSTGTFVKNKNASWNVTGVGGIPENWTVKTA